MTIKPLPIEAGAAESSGAPEDAGKTIKLNAALLAQLEMQKTPGGTRRLPGTGALTGMLPPGVDQEALKVFWDKRKREAGKLAERQIATTSAIQWETYSMTIFSRRLLLGSIAASPLAMPGIIRAQSTSKPIRIGLLSDMSGPYRDVGGPGNHVATELAIEDVGGSVLDRPIEILQADDQNKPDVAASLARQWVDDQGGDVLADGAASSSGLAVQQIAREKKTIYLVTGPASSDFTGKQCSPYSVHFSYDTYALAHGTGSALTKSMPTTHSCVAR